MQFMRRIFLVLALAFMPGVQEALAQAADPDFEQWRRVATRAEQAIDAGRASEAAMDSLREQLIEWRDAFSGFQSQARISISSLETRLETLGPKPEAPEEEPAEIAELRGFLTSELAQARVPIVRAEIAEAEANKLVEGIDKLIRSRQTNALLERGASPLNLKIWRDGLTTMVRSAQHIAGEVTTAWAYERREEDFGHNVLRFFVLLAMALALLTRGSSWTRRGLEAVQTEEMSSLRWLISFFLSLGYVVLPMVGVYLVVEAVYATDLAGLRGDRILSALPAAAFLFLMPSWIGNRIFNAHGTSGNRARLKPHEMRRGRVASVLVGGVMATYHVIQTIAAFDNWSADVRAVVILPLIVAAGFLMLRFAKLFRTNVQANLELSEGEAKYYDHFVNLIARFYQVAAIAGVAMALVGYTRAAEALVFPAIYTVQLVAFLILLHRLFVKVFSVAQGEQAERDRALWPLLMSFGMVLLSLPVFLWIWGMRPQEISQLYGRILSGFRVGDITVSPTQVIWLILVFSIGFALTRLIQSFLKNTLLPRTNMDIGARNAVVAGVGYVGIFAAAMVALNNTGIDLGSIALVASALSVGIGFGLQTIVSNFVSGIILLIERPITEGDWIEVNGQMGYVRDISVRSTRIETFDRTDVIVPNGDLVAGTVTNYTRGNTVGRVIVPVGVAYGTDPRLVEKILLDVANAHPMVLATPAPYVVFQGFGASSLDFEIRALLRDVNWVLSVRSDMNYEIAKRFMEEGIEIPFPQQDIWLRNPERIGHPVQVEPVNPAEMQSVPGSSYGQADAPEAADGGDGDGDR